MITNSEWPVHSDYSLYTLHNVDSKYIQVVNYYNNYWKINTQVNKNKMNLML